MLNIGGRSGFDVGRDIQGACRVCNLISLNLIAKW